MKTKVDYYCPFCGLMVIEPDKTKLTVAYLTRYSKNNPEVQFSQPQNGNIQLFHYSCYINSLNAPF